MSNNKFSTTNGFLVFLENVEPKSAHSQFLAWCHVLYQVRISSQFLNQLYDYDGDDGALAVPLNLARDHKAGEEPSRWKKHTYLVQNITCIAIPVHPQGNGVMGCGVLPPCHLQTKQRQENIHGIIEYDGDTSTPKNEKQGVRRGRTRKQNQQTCTHTAPPPSLAPSMTSGAGCTAQHRPPIEPRG